MIKNKKIIVAIGIVLTIFLTWNIVWFVHYFNLKGYTKNIPRDDGVYVTSDAEENSYSVKLPNYLQFNGNLALVDSNSHSLIIWVSLTDSKTYGVQICRKELKSDNFTFYSMLLDEDGQLLAEGNLDDAQEVYNANKEIIDKLYENANDFWVLK